jgi:hypothetical protein
VRTLLAAALLAACIDDADPLPDGGGADARPDAGPTDTGATDTGTFDSGIRDGSSFDSGACAYRDPSGENCVGCQPDGECCAYSINCAVGSICNSETELLYDPGQPDFVCVRVVCATDADCPSGRECTLEHVCRKPTCQVDGDCPPGDRCLGGACALPPSIADVASCEVAGDGVITWSGETIDLEAIARDRAGRPLPGLTFDWATSDEQRATIDGGEVIGGLLPGSAELTASIGSIPCSGTIPVTNFSPPGGGEVRVVAYEHGLGRPITGAAVTIAGNSVVTGVTGSFGDVVLPVTGPVTSITVTASGAAAVSILGPIGDAFRIPMPSIDVTSAGGSRGRVIPGGRPADVPLALVGESLSEDVLTLGRVPLTGRDLVRTVIDAPELGFDMQELALPGGFLFGLGSRDFMNDGNGPRCQGMPVGADDIGCFLVRSDEGHNAVWTFAGSLRLSQVVAIANELSALLGGDPAAAAELVPAFLPILRTIDHGTEPSILTSLAPRVPSGAAVDCSDPALPGYLDLCAPDFTAYAPLAVDAATRPSIASVVTMPDLDAFPAGCAERASLMAAVSLGSRGLVPLGFGEAKDVADAEAPDCRAAGARRPFGDASDDLLDGQIGLSTAPRHSALEGHTLLLVASAKSAPGAPFARSIRIDRLAMLDRFITVAPFIPAPTAEVEVAAARVTFAPAAGTFSRVELYGGGRAWIVYAPGSMAELLLPDVPSARVALSNLAGAFVLQGEGADYESMFGMTPNPRHADRTADYVTAFTVQGCAPAGSACTIR